MLDARGPSPWVSVKASFQVLFGFRVTRRQIMGNLVRIVQLIRSWLHKLKVKGRQVQSYDDGAERLVVDTGGSRGNGDECDGSL